jgi:hypothetical protein
MSLMSLLTTNSNQTTYGYGTGMTGLSGTTPTIQTATSTPSTTAASANSASISLSAKIAAAEQSDNAKDFTTLSNDVRATLDAAYAAAKTAGKNGAPDLSEMSGRALAAIILNKTASFSGSEQSAARSELQQRTRDEFTTAVSSGSGLTALTGYNQLLVGEYDSISPEEREARGWTSALRDSAASFINSTSGSSTGNSSLFDLLNDDGTDPANTSLF